MFKRIKQAWNLFKLNKLAKQRNASGRFIRFQSGNAGLMSINGENFPAVEELTDVRHITFPRLTQILNRVEVIFDGHHVEYKVGEKCQNLTSPH